MAAGFECTPNPYNVKPMGIALIRGRAAFEPRWNGLGCFSPLSDSALLLSFLPFLDGPELAQLSATSRVFYVFCHQFELWRTLTLERWGGDFVFRNSWYQTFVDRWRREQKKDGDVCDHIPLPMSEVYSDILHKAAACAGFLPPAPWFENPSVPPSAMDPSLPFPPSPPRKGLVEPVGIPRVPATISVAEFVRLFEVPNRPVILEGAAASWSACELFNIEKLPSASPELWKKKVTAGGFRFRLCDFVSYASHFGADDQPLYVFDRAALSSPLVSTSYSPPAPFEASRDTFSLLDGEEEEVECGGEGEGGKQSVRLRPDFKWLIAGGKMSGSAFHKDPNLTCAWNAVLCGRKRWILYPPRHAPPGVHASADGAEVTQPLSLAEWMMDYYPQTRRPGSPCHAVEAVCGPGDVMFVPRGWWHMALNLDPWVVAITQNYVPPCAVPAVLHFLRTKPDQVSGVPPLAAPLLHDRLIRNIVTQRPHLLENAPEYFPDGKLRPGRATQSWAIRTQNIAERATAHEDEDGDGHGAATSAFSTAPTYRLGWGTGLSMDGDGDEDEDGLLPWARDPPTKKM